MKDKLKKRLQCRDCDIPCCDNLSDSNIDWIMELTNQRVIEELEEQMELAEIGNSYTRLRERVQELKQD